MTTLLIAAGLVVAIFLLFSYNEFTLQRDTEPKLTYFKFLKRNTDTNHFHLF